MIKKKIITIIAIIIVLFLAVNVIKNNRQPNEPIMSGNYPVVEKSYEVFKIKGETSKNGAGDPSIEYDNRGIGWMSYSGAADDKVNIHLAKSADNGKTWNFVQKITFPKDETLTLEGEQLQGGWHNEVSTLVYDPDDPGKEWKLYWHKFFKADKKRILQFGWIAYKYASNPEGKWSEEIPLFGARQFPFEPYKTQIDLSSIDSELKNIFVYTEPGSIYKDKILYLAFQSHGKGIVKTILIASDNHGKTWKYINTLLDSNYAEDFGASYFSGTSLAEENGRIFLLVTPEAAESKSKKFQHKGTLIFEFEDIVKGKLKEVGGKPVVHKYLKPSLKTGGLSDYDEENTNGGILMFQMDTSMIKPGSDPNEIEIFKIYNTKEKIINY